MNSFYYNYSMKNKNFCFYMKNLFSLFSNFNEYNVSQSNIENVVNSIENICSEFNDKIGFIFDCSPEEFLKLADCIEKVVIHLSKIDSLLFILYKEGIELVKKYNNCYLLVEEYTIENNIDFEDILYIINKKKYYCSILYRKKIKNSYKIVPYWVYLLDKCYKLNVDEKTFYIICDFIKDNFECFNKIYADKEIKTYSDNEIIDVVMKNISFLSNKIDFLEKIIVSYFFILEHLPLSLCKIIYNDIEKIINSTKYTKYVKQGILNGLLINKEILSDMVFYKKVFNDLIICFSIKSKFDLNHNIIIPDEIIKKISNKKLIKYFKWFSKNFTKKNEFYQSSTTYSRVNYCRRINFLINPNVFNALGISLSILEPNNKSRYDACIKIYNDLVKR